MESVVPLRWKLPLQLFLEEPLHPSQRALPMLPLLPLFLPAASLL